MKITPQALTELGFKVTGSELVPGNLPNLIQTDTRKLQQGDWFWALSGERFDGHEFIRQAIDKGALGVTYEIDKSPQLSAVGSLPHLGIDDSLRGLQVLANYWRHQADDLQLIGLTGSNGKTTVKELLGHVLKSIAPTLATSSNFNNEIGVPLTLCQITAQHRYAVVEMGARHEGNIAELCNIAHPTVSVLLNVGRAHLGEFGSLETLRKTKLEMFTATSSNVVAVCPADDKKLLPVAQKTHDRVVSFGLHSDADVQWCHTHLRGDGGCDLDFRIGDQQLQLPLSLYHETLGINCATVLACLVALDRPLADISPAFADFQGVKRRFELVPTTDLLLIDDSYNANPDSMLAGLRSLQTAFGKYAKILVLGDMLELGTDSVREHKTVGEYCAKLDPTLLVGVGQQAQYLVEGACQAGLPPSRCRHFADVEAVLEQWPELQNRGDLLYLKASNSLNFQKIVDHIRSHERI